MKRAELDVPSMPWRNGRSAKSASGSPLLDWLHDPDTERGFHFCDEDGWSLETYEELAWAVREAAHRIEQVRSVQDQIVALVLADSREFVAAFLGTILAGGTPCPLVPPFYFRDPDDYARHTSFVLAASDPAVIVTDEVCWSSVREAALRTGDERNPLRFELTGERVEFSPRPRAPLGLLQFTSGSSGTPRGVQVTLEALAGNAERISRWVPVTRDTASVSWLPLYHDMGLIGQMLTPISQQGDLWLMRPDQFLTRPIRWLEPLGRHGAVIGTSPSFGYAFAAKRIKPEQLEGFDFSAWTAANVAAERTDPAALERFSQLLEPYGFNRSAFKPAYGLAEATLLVTGYGSERARVARLDWSSVTFGSAVEIEEVRRIGDPEIGDGTGWVTSCGPAREDVSVTIVDEDGRPLPEGWLGEIRVNGAHLALGYLRDDVSTQERFTPEGLRTKDAGFLMDGELYVIGRMGDSVKIRGRSVYMEDIETALGQIPGIKRGRCVAVAAPGSEMVVAIVESEPGEWVDPAMQLLHRETGGTLGIRLLSGEQGSIMKTSSGKPRRRVMWRHLMNGGIDGTTLVKDFTPAAIRPVPAVSDPTVAPATVPAVSDPAVAPAT